ncbi:6762_t:CDS:2, partial [Gigaspora margarita]
FYIDPTNTRQRSKDTPLARSSNDTYCLDTNPIWNDTTIPATPYIAKLDTSSWMWSIPNLSQINSPELCYHSAALYGDYMIIAFGNYCIMHI